MDLSSNIDEVMEWLKDWVDGIDFTKTGKDQSLGRDMAKLVAERIAYRSSSEHRGAGSPWPPNSTNPSRRTPQGYAEWKREKYGWSNAPNYRTGQMLSELSLYGRTTIAAHEIMMVYGTGTTPFTSAAPTGLLSEADKMVKDTDKAVWNSDKRPFYELDDAISEAVVEVAQDWCNARIIQTNAQNHA